MQLVAGLWQVGGWVGIQIANRQGNPDNLTKASRRNVSYIYRDTNGEIKCSGSQGLMRESATGGGQVRNDTGPNPNYYKKEENKIFLLILVAMKIVSI